jgi:hypothetical protein
MPFSLRLDPETEAKIRRLSAVKGRSKSEVVRDAVAQYEPEFDTPPERGESAFDRLKPYVGIVRTGGANYSRHTHAKYRALLQRQRRGTRSR